MNAFKRLLIPLLPAALLFACNDDISEVGSSLTKGEISIVIDTIDLEAPIVVERTPVIDSRSTTCLVGNLSLPEYGDLKCNFVARMMCASSISMPTTIPLADVDSMKLLVRVPRSEIIGDSLAPQQITVYELTRQLPDDLTNQFDPTGYYDPSKPMGRRSFCLSNLGMDDDNYEKAENITIPFKLSTDMARDIVTEYRENPSTFAWPSTFAQYFPGLFVEQTFGTGCMANIESADINIYYHTMEEETDYDDDGAAFTKEVAVVDSVAPFAMAPEVLSSNNISYEPSAALKKMVADGEPIIATPAGYACRMTFPTRKLVARFFENDATLGVINNLSFKLPAEEIENDFGITPPPYLLMVKSDEYDTFFDEGKLPDSKTSFWASYNSSKGTYAFSSMRDFILPIVDKPEAEARQEPDTEFVLIPVLIGQETYTDSYGSSHTILVRCVPYIEKPTMARLKPEDAEIVFTFSYQEIL